MLESAPLLSLLCREVLFGDSPPWKVTYQRCAAPSLLAWSFPASAVNPSRPSPTVAAETGWNPGRDGSRGLVGDEGQGREGGNLDSSCIEQRRQAHKGSRLL